MRREKANIYYLYCTVEAFISIVKNKTIRLSDPLKMNDRTELLSLYKKLDNYIRSNHIKDFYSKKVINALNKFLKNGQNHIFITCFSEEPDLLGQWILYGDKGNGVAIGFDINKIKSRDDRLFIEKINYIDEIDAATYNTIISTYYAASTSSVMSKYSKEKNVFYKELTNESIKYKDVSFSAEKEWRLIYKRQKINWNDDDISPFKSKMKKINFCPSGNNDIKSFIEIDLEPEDIKKIILGPKCSIGKQEVVGFIESSFGLFKGKQNSVVKSKIPFR